MPVPEKMPRGPDMHYLNARNARCHHLGPLHSQRVSQLSLQHYLRHVQRFLYWVQLCGGTPLDSEALLDNSVHKYVEFL